MEFDWKRDVPLWAMLKWQSSLPHGRSMLTNWLPTPKGGKLVYTYHDGQVSTWQVYK
jgi:hypothetical protein